MILSDGTLVNPFPSDSTAAVSRNVDQVPIYAADGTPYGYRSRLAAERLLQAGFVTAAYGRQRHLKAIFLRQEDGANPVEAHLRVGRRYSYQQHLDCGYYVWVHKRLRPGDVPPNDAGSERTPSPEQAGTSA